MAPPPKQEELQPYPVKDQLPSISHCITSPPPWPEAVLLSFQHYLVMLGTTVLVPTSLVPQMGGGNAIDAAALVIQHPDGRLERMYWPVPASEVMRANPGHYVSIIIPLPTEADGGEEGEEAGRKKKPKTVRFTCVKLLRPTDTLGLGHAYRLVTSQEVMKVLRAKKNGKTKQQQQRPQQQQQDEVVVVPGHGKACQNRDTGEVSDKENNDGHNQEVLKKHQIQGQGMQQAASMGSGRRSKTWRPSLQSIDEDVS